jgi:hypothetical protein
MPGREPTIVLHVGAVPTASWLIQRCLTGKRAAWPPNTHPLSAAILRRDIGSGQPLVADPEGFSRTLRQAFSEPGIDVVIGSRPMLGRAFGGPSGSGLHAEADDTIQALADATRPYRRVIILSVCPQVQLLEMHLEEAIAGTGATRLDTWLDSVDLDNLSWLPVHDKLTTALGSESVIVHSFRRTQKGRVDFLRDFLAAGGLQLPDAEAKRTPAPNPRLSQTGWRLAIAADAHLVSNKQRADLRTFLLRNFSELDGPVGAVLTDDQRSALHQRYDSELEALAVSAPVGVDGGR